MIITELTGGLGNQLFQYALGRFLAHKYNAELKLDLTQCEKEKFTHHNYYHLEAFNITENFATKEDIKCCCFFSLEDFSTLEGDFYPEVLECGDNVYLSGLLMCEKYFIGIEDIIRSEITLKNPLEKVATAWKEKILSVNCAVSIHVRHGDYFKPSAIDHGILPVDYYLRALRQLKNEFEDISVFVFSDDLKWCKENFKFDVPTEFVEGCEHDFEEMYLMSLCKHNIIANSTFSWWGAWLNQNPNKKVFAPNPWIKSLLRKDIIPNGWIKVPIDYSASTPKNLSMIVYVKETTDDLLLLLSSCITQNHKNYEIIIVDASTDGSGKIYRKLAEDEKVTILRVDPSENKVSAWNRGFEISRGDYVLFLAEKEFILPNTVSIIFDICDETLEKSANSSENYITYDTYLNYCPNIICSTQNFEESDTGSAVINIFPDKNFSLNVSETFQNLDDIVELNISSNKKLLLLGNQGIDELLGTKIFKREFLNKNHIRFNEDEGVDAELAFIVNAFMSTEKIMFVPQFFYGRFK